MDEEQRPEVPEGAEGAAVLPLIPPELGVHPLLLAVLHAVVFLDGSDESLVDPEAGGEALEYVAAYLQRLQGPERQRVAEDLACLAGYARDQNWPKAMVRFFKESLDDMGAEGGDES
jgi:hypothetical protein